MAIALPLRAGEAGEAGPAPRPPVDQIVDAWIDLKETDDAVTEVVYAWISEQQVGLTLALDKKLADDSHMETAVPHLDPIVIRVSTLPVMRLPQTPSI